MRAAPFPLVFIPPLLPFFLAAFLPGPAEGGCPFQNPFWFVEKPMVVPVVNDVGEVLPDRIRITWGRMKSFECVDYFQARITKKQGKRVKFSNSFSSLG